MSPTKRPSAVGLRKGLGTAEKRIGEMTDAEIAALAGEIEAKAEAARIPQPKPARVTLNMPPQLYRELSRWADDAAAEMDVPRLGVQDALRAMIRVTLADRGIATVVIDQARRDSEN